MKIELFGVRGSMPSPGKQTATFGGNTSCVYVQQSNGESVILDSGTGIVELGERLIDNSAAIAILLTHNHWDHIQGFPFFKPIHQLNRNITIAVGNVDDKTTKNAILTQMSGSCFPVKHQNLPANISLNTQLSQQPSFTINDFFVTTAPLNHPDGGTAYCVYADGRKLAYITDNELDPPGEVQTSIEQWVKFIKGADLLIHDAQFTNDDLSIKHGWGHSTMTQVADLARLAQIKNIAIISHDPSRTDDELLAIEAYLQTQYQDLSIECGREGRVYQFSPI
ncbi:MBL fold metallo-hydrolase [Pseudoalteromonas sp.]|uniref:MBL fold metallo-hydrolase n=1 Tax=Pseudoalteromonas sp. TaxID=53249 RepID=UPI0035665C0B